MADYAGQMQAHADATMQLLANKRTNLAAPGTAMNSLYYGVGNSTVEAVELTFDVGRYTTDLSSTIFGSTSTNILANSSFVGDTYLHLELPNLYPGQTLSRGWGYGIIQTLSFIFGSSNVSQLTISGQTLWHKVSMSAESAEKRSELFRLGGQEYLAPIIRVSPITGLPERDPDAIISADILLPLPWSSSAGLFQKKAFDTNLLTSPIQVQVQFGQAKAIFGGSQSPNGFPDRMLRGTMIFRQGNLYSKAMSLRNILMANPDTSTFYPFIYTQSYPTSIFAGQNQPESQVSIPLQAFINADLVAITLSVIRVSQLAAAPNASPNWHQCDNIQNVTLDYNGTVMFQAPRDSWKLMTMRSTVGAQYFHNSLIQVVPPYSASDTNSFTSVPQDCYDLHIDFSAIRSMTFEGHFQNVWRIANNTLTLRFNTEGDNTVPYQLFASYHYNGVAQVQQGQTSIYFD